MMKLNMLRNFGLAGVLMSGLLATAQVQAHTEEYFDSIEGPNGGQLRMAGAYHFELVLVKDSADAKTNPVKVYVSDHGDKPQDVSGASATVLMVYGKQKVKLELKPAGGNLLQGETVYASDEALKAVVSVQMKDQGAVQAQFEPLKAKPAKAEDDGHGHHHH